MFCFLLFFTLSVTNANSINYNKTDMKEKYGEGYGTEFLFFPSDNDENYKVGYLKKPMFAKMDIGSIEDVEKFIHFTLYTRTAPNGEEIKTRVDLKKSSFDKSKKTKLVTHGWLSSGKSDTCLTITNNYLNVSDVNVFVMDWGEIADNTLYPVPMKATPNVAKYYASFLNYLIDNLGVEPKDIHMIGHSLGAHVSGFAARGVNNGKIGRVTGLDPAFPGFAVVELVEGGRLQKEDADFVDVIHTCVGILGIEAPLGDVDFYPNGGVPPQPGCENILEMMEACSHGRSWKYFAYSIITNKPYLAINCNNYDDFLWNKNCKSQPIPMGEFVPRNAQGVYYLKTNNLLPI